jgi:murein L,D-transpeptidase YafK
MRESVRSVAMTIAAALPLVTVAAPKADLVVVKKSESRLYLYRDSQAFAEFRVSFGSEPKGHKQQEGDERTPEGRYVLDAKNLKSAFYRAIHLSYPNAQDVASAKARGVQPGGQIMIHGQRNGLGWLAPVAQWFNWTDGCVGLSNKDMDAVWSAVDVGTPIQIYP